MFLWYDHIITQREMMALAVATLLPGVPPL